MFGRLSRAAGARLSVGVSIALVAALASACGADSSSSGAAGSDGGSDTYKIGALLALTGPYSALGTAEQESVKLFAETVNSKGGINGHKIEIVVADTASDESQAVNQFRKLVTQDNVVAVIGPSSSGEGIATKPTSLSLKTPIIVPASSQSIVTPANEAKYSFKEFPSTELSLKAQLEYVKSKGWKNVAIIASNNGYGQEPVKTLPGMVSSYGLTVVGSATFPPDATDVTSQLSSLAGKKPDVTLVWAVNPANAIVAKNAKAISYPGVLFNSPGASTNAYIEVGGEATEGTLVQGSKIAVPESIESSDSQYDALQGLLAAWKTGHQDSPSQYAANGWDCMLILQQALEAGKVQPGDPQKTRDAIRDSLEANVKDLPGINAIYSFGPDSHGPSDIKGLAVLTVQNKKFSLLQSF
jgi:ABC-type branched-chain amino acid transport systems, periplasmic component